MRNLVNRLRREKASIEESLIRNTKTGISVNELVEKEWKLKRIESILGGVKDTMTKYTTIARYEYLNRKRIKEKAIV